MKVDYGNGTLLDQYENESSGMILFWVYYEYFRGSFKDFVILKMTQIWPAAWG